MEAFEHSDWDACWRLVLGDGTPSGDGLRASVADVAERVPVGDRCPGNTVLHIAACRWACGRRCPGWMWEVYQERLGPTRPRPAPASARLSAAAAIVGAVVRRQ